jgi:hypothetical protein
MCARGGFWKAQHATRNNVGSRNGRSADSCGDRHNGRTGPGMCGYSPRDKSTIECGYTSLTACESALGHAGLCFADPEYALNAHGKAPVTTAQSTAKKTQPLAASFER